VGYKPLTLADLSEAPLTGATIASTYSVCGGTDIGFRLAGFKPVWANELDAHAAATYSATLGNHVAEGDIDSVAWPERGSVDVVIGGPPCQGFSVAGKMDPTDPRSQHVCRFMDIVEHVAPRAFVVENVKALAVSPRWRSIRKRLEERTDELGYRARMLVLHAADFGVPQRRERMFMIGMRVEEPPASIPRTFDYPVTVRQALAHLPAFGEPGNRSRCAAEIVPAKRPVLRSTAFRGSLLFNGSGRVLELDSTAPTLPASMSGNATPIIDQHEVETFAEPWVVSYHRQLRAGGPPVSRAPAHMRRVTVEEAAQLQSFPLGMVFSGPLSAKYRQIGNAVPPPMAFAVAQAIARCLGPVTSQQLAAAVD
jgi:DNA (cytosine-5)-methyltransferase 1